ncbi:MAG TPA: cache domain-containing protein [Stellaceae bacterium]|nr:cache domain-containing protein [Stellaceae bacterium]
MAQSKSERPLSMRAQVATAGLLIIIVVALVCGIVWYNFKKTAALSVLEGQRLLTESASDIVHQVELFYEPVLAIVALASRVPGITERAAGNERLAMEMTGLKRYPHLLSLYVGYDNGDFDLVTRVGGEDRAVERQTLGAPDNAAFAHEVIRSDDSGVRRAAWSFLDGGGNIIEQRPPTEAGYDPRVREWYRLAQGDDNVHRSDPYVFASSQDIGITISRRLQGSNPGVFGADLAIREVANFLSQKKITDTSKAFIFNSQGEIVAYPDESKINRTVKDPQTSALVPTTVADLKDPVVAAVFEGSKKLGYERTIPLEVNGHSYIAEVVPIAQQFGGTDFLGIVVPVDEITAPIEVIRLEALIYSVVALALVLPLYGILVFAWLDRRLGRNSSFDIKGLSSEDLE